VTEILEKLIAAGIQLLPAHIENYFVFERDGFVALVERREDGFGRIGTPGLLTEKGPAPLVWKGQSAYFVAKGLEQPASEEQVAAIRRFSDDLKAALN
jgi:hypothetical protein